MPQPLWFTGLHMTEFLYSRKRFFPYLAPMAVAPEMSRVSWEMFVASQASTQVDQILSPNDAAEVFEELLPAQNRSFVLGMKLKLQHHEVEAIHSMYANPRDRLLHIILAFLKQAERQPTWGVVVKALWSPSVNLPWLARKVEAAHFPKLTITRGYNTERLALKGEIKGFHRRFNSIKKATIMGLEKCRMAVTTVVYLLTSVISVGEHKKVLEEKQEKLFDSKNNWVLFTHLNHYWNPLSYQLLEGLIDELVEWEKVEFAKIKEDMDNYKKDMEMFRRTTLLSSFCHVAPDMFGFDKSDPPSGFQKLVTEHHWPETITLEDVEKFRKEFMCSLQLPDCAMMVNGIRRKCFEIVWFVVLPVSTLQLLSSNKSAAIFKKFRVSSVEIGGECVYRDPSMLPYQASGPGLTSATVNYPTHILVERTDSSRSVPQQWNLTSQLECFAMATPFSESRMSKKRSLPGAVTSPSQYEVSYTPVTRGQHKLHVQVNDREINGSPFTVTVYPDPRQLGLPVRTVTDLNGPYSIAFNRHQEMIVSECGGHRLSIFDIRGQKIRTFGSYGNSPNQMIYPKGVATDDTDNIYVSSQHKLQKFTSSGELIKCIGKKGRKEGELDDPRGVTLYDNQVYVCDRNNHIQVFDLDLNFVRFIGSHGKGRGEFNKPYDVKFDTAGNMYVAEFGNGRVQVLDTSGQFIRAFDQGREGKLSWPTGFHIVDKYVYMSDDIGNCIVVYETSCQFVTLFGSYGQNEGEFRSPRSITCCTDGFIYVCDCWNNRIQIF